jgi:hypothetical protein
MLRYRGFGLVWWILMILLGAASLYFPDSWIGRNYAYILLAFGFSLYCLLALTIDNLHSDINRINSQLQFLSGELDSISRGLENVHDRLWNEEHKDGDTHASGD